MDQTTNRYRKQRNRLPLDEMKPAMSRSTLLCHLSNLTVHPSPVSSVCFFPKSRDLFHPFLQSILERLLLNRWLRISRGRVDRFPVQILMIPQLLRENLCTILIWYQPSDRLHFWQPFSDNGSHHIFNPCGVRKFIWN